MGRIQFSVPVAMDAVWIMVKKYKTRGGSFGLAGNYARVAIFVHKVFPPHLNTWPMLWVYGHYK